MLDTRTIVQRFLETKMQVHPDVVRYLAEQNNPRLIETIIDGLPKDTIVVSLKHIPAGLPGLQGSVPVLIHHKYQVPDVHMRFHALGFDGHHGRPGA